ncbi:MAG TPA: hypothetical protein VGT02_12880 [Methylomirabilota bacterium]|nr:hypothetical protein [Methylomirabilota bacterium]
MTAKAARAPSPMLPLGFLAAAALAFVAAGLALPWLADALAGHYYHPRVLALTHTVTLGWITLTILGASYQLIPIVLERPVWSERLGRWELGLGVLGVIGVVGHVALASWPGLVWSAGLVAAAVAAHVVNTALTLRGLERWSFTAGTLAMGLAGLVLTTLFGAALGAEHVRAFLPGDFYARLHAHVHLALLGWVLPVVLGVSAHVYPLFLLAPRPGRRVVAVQAVGLAVGVPAVVIGLLAAPPLAAAGALAVGAAVVAHVVWVAGLLRASRRPSFDWALRFLVAGAAYLAATAAFGVALAFDAVSGPRWALAYGVLALGGWASLTIAGMMLKIVPFLVWYRVYAPLAGRMPVPGLADLRWPAAEAVAFLGLTGGVAALAIAAGAGHVGAIRIAAAVVLVGALAFGATIATTLHHLVPCPPARGGARVVSPSTASTPTRAGVNAA